MQRVIKTITRQCHHHSIKLEDYHVIGLQNHIRNLTKEIKNMEKTILNLSLKIRAQIL